MAPHRRCARARRRSLRWGRDPIAARAGLVLLSGSRRRRGVGPGDRLDDRPGVGSDDRTFDRQPLHHHHRRAEQRLELGALGWIEGPAQALVEQALGAQEIHR